MHDILDSFHPAVANWFRRTYTVPTLPQAQAWPLIQSGRHVLIAAPTGSGKTLAAFLATIDALVRLGVRGQLGNETRVVYVSPLKALSNDIHRNLEEPLAGIRQELVALGYPDVEIRTLVRTGDTPQADRSRMRRQPPHILVTTPESLYILLTSESGRETLASTRTVIVDEIHALAPNKRGVHLSLCLERLEELTGARLTRVGLSATQRPIEDVARFLVGTQERPARGLLDEVGPPIDLFDQDLDRPIVRSPDAAAAAAESGISSKAPDSAWLHPGYGSALALGTPSTTRSPDATEPTGMTPAAESGLTPGAPDSASLHSGYGSTSVVAGCTILDTGHTRKRDLALELPEAPLEAVMSAEVWELVYERITELIQEHRSTLVFVNTRRLAERLARALSERLGEEQVTSHHGSLAREQRLKAEQKLKRGELKALVATSSLELGIDIGHVDLVCQISTPRAISALLQRVGRSGHAVGGLPKGRLFPLTRDDLVECAALLDAVRRGELDCLRFPQQPLDVLAQQIAAEVACRECDEAQLFDLFRRAWPYRNLTREQYDAVVKMLAEGFSTRRGRSHALIHRDTVQGALRARKGLRLTAITCGGTIPDTADYNVVLEPEGQIVGTVNEDFAIESMAGDVFQLGNASYRILRVEGGRVRVEDAHGLPPSIPFWLGEAPGRSDEVSAAVSRLREEIDARLDPYAGSTLDPHRGPPDRGSEPGAAEWLMREVGLPYPAAAQIVDYLSAAKAALTRLPTQKHLVFERFFDESGGTQLVIHSPYGSRVNRAWGLSLRKRFCRKFNFELQAAATEDAIILSLTATHSFPLDEPARYLHSSSVRDLLVQALLDAPMFITRWRWNAAIALALLRFRGGSKVPPQLQRMQAEDLIAAVFPDQMACFENIVGDREIPDHPLVQQTVHDCLHEAMDIEGLERLLRGLEAGEVDVTARDLAVPSMLALEVLAARPYAFLDDAPLEERRTQAVMARRWLDADTAADLGRLDPDAIRRVREEAWPQPESADEMCDALSWLGFLTEEEAQANVGWAEMLRELSDARRAACLYPSPQPSPAGGEGAYRSGPPSPVVQGEGALYPSPRPSPAGREGAYRSGPPSPVQGEGALYPSPRPSPAGGEGAYRSGPPSPVQGEGALYPSPRPSPAGGEGAYRSRPPSPVQGEGALSPSPLAGEGRGEGSSAASSGALWFSTDRIPQLRAVFPDAAIDPTIGGQPDVRPGTEQAWTREAALIELIRGRFEGLGPTTASALAASLAVPPREIDVALLALEAEGFVMRGNFTGQTAEVEWCDRRLLARINRYTVKRLRQEIEPVSSADFMRFLLAWQHALPGERMDGPDALAAVVSQLEGYEAAAGAWETEILPARLASYEPAWLDDLCLSGRVLWTRLEAPRPNPERERGVSPVRSTPVTLLTRKNLAIWAALVRAAGPQDLHLSARARGVADFLGEHGASFFDDIVHGLDLPRTFVEEALAELVGVGLVNSDGFSGLRALLLPSDKRKPFSGGGRRRAAMPGVEDAGRWALIRRKAPAPSADGAPLPRETVEQIARTLLKRYGVVFWRVLAREAQWLPPWRELLLAFRRLETRGDIRGGRFVAGFSGEQFALPEAVGVLRSARKDEEANAVTVLCGADPLNLAGIVTPGPKVSALYSNRLLLRDGVPVAALIGGEAHYFEQMTPETAWDARNLLLRGSPARAPVEEDRKA